MNKNMNIPMAPKALSFVSSWLLVSIPIINNGWYLIIVPTYA